MNPAGNKTTCNVGVCMHGCMWVLLYVCVCVEIKEWPNIS